MPSIKINQNTMQKLVENFDTCSLVQKLDGLNFSQGIHSMLIYYVENLKLFSDFLDNSLTSYSAIKPFYQEKFIVTKKDLQILNYNQWVLNCSNHKLNSQLLSKLLDIELSISIPILVPKYRGKLYGTICLLKCVLQFIGSDDRLVYIDFEQDIREAATVARNLDRQRRLKRHVEIFDKRVTNQCNKLYELQSQIQDAYNKCSMINIDSESEILYYSAELTKILINFFINFKKLMKYSSNDLVDHFDIYLKRNLLNALTYCAEYDSHFVYTIECIYAKLVQEKYEPSLYDLFKEKQCCCFSNMTYRCTPEELSKFIKLSYVGCDCDDDYYYASSGTYSIDSDQEDNIFDYDEDDIEFKTLKSNRMIENDYYDSYFEESKIYY